MGGRPEVSNVVGNHDKLQPHSWAELAAGTAADLLVSDVMELRETASHMVDHFIGHTPCVFAGTARV